MNLLENQLFNYLSASVDRHGSGGFKYSELLIDLQLNLEDLANVLVSLEDKHILQLAVFPNKDWFVVELSN